MNIAQMTPPGQFYHVLLLMTDGEIHDMDITLSLVVQASTLPLSIIIVGLGNEDFRNMEILDSDTGLLRDREGRQASRDIVQFVPFRKYGGNPYLLAQEVLAEIPKQISEYMQRIGHVPILPEEMPLEMMMPISSTPPPPPPPEGSAPSIEES
mmetsp:Transcript_8435/g.8347  ORF Transcript_8435/g.8347 Transcript_8435/m.8347 type:complete len:153 (-) Transcript_8435:20-478(-)